MEAYQEQYKGYYIRPHKDNPTNYIIVKAGTAGRIPKVLDGSFTSRGWAKGVIDHYLESKDAEASPKS
jgi:hypothetical protein